ncbi:hypothetical protein KA005_01660 [bacterium]|nr:hypothetical protein [bacterium]
MKRILCCLAWWLGAAFFIIAYLICVMFGSFFLGPYEAQKRCQPILDKLKELANCCAGKEG